MRIALISLLATSLSALGAMADPLMCGVDEEGDPLSFASPEVCQIIEDESPDEVYGWSMNRGRATEFDQFVLITRSYDLWEVRAYVTARDEEESEILLVRPDNMPSEDADFWETYGSDDNAMLTETETRKRFETEIPASIGLALRAAIDEDRAAQLAQSITLDDYYSDDGSICVSHHILNVYLVRDGKTKFATRWGCGYLTEIDKFTNEVNDPLIELGLLTLDDVDYISVRPPQENDK